MRKRVYTSFVWLSGFALLLGGCQSAEEPPVAAAPSDEAKDKPESDATVADAADDTADDASDTAKSNEPTPAVEAQASASKPFNPPFPNRVDLFEPLKRAEGTLHRGDTTEELVELKGFVNVDEPRVVLSIDGVIAPLPEGGQKYGVQVISIQPPSVVLQRGRSRWTATLE